MGGDERMVVKLLAEPGSPDGIRLSFWALHTTGDIERLGAALARQSAVRA